MTPIKDSTKTTIVDHAIDMRVNQQNFKTLTPENARVHLGQLATMLGLTYDVCVQKLPKDAGQNQDFLAYLQQLALTLDAIGFKHELEAINPNRDIQLACTIDPSDSGFPIFVRDFKFLASDQANAAAQLASMPDDRKLVDDALYLLFRGLFPKNVVTQKLMRQYYRTLLALTLPETLRIHPVKEAQERDGLHYCTQSVERLDEHHNLPRFYTFYLRIPEKTYPRPEWQDELRRALAGGFSTVTALELGYLAQQVEALEGIQLECVERFDIGPFYSAFTENGPAVSTLIEAANDNIMMFSKTMVVRTGEIERVGLRERWLGWTSGDEAVGQFSPPIASPQYILMSHRLIQKVHNLNINLKDHTKMFGITSKGEIYE